MDAARTGGLNNDGRTTDDDEGAELIEDNSLVEHLRNRRLDMAMTLDTLIQGADKVLVSLELGGGQSKKVPLLANCKNFRTLFF